MCNWAFWIFLLLFLLALGLLAIGTLGLFGQPKDPLAAVFIMPLGLPWIIGVLLLPAPVPALIVAAPLLNLALLGWCWRVSATR